MSSTEVVAGAAELLLHEGEVPPHLLQLMKRLGRAIVLHILDVFGPQEIVRRLADPLWFQAFNNVIGMDWDSSGSTTVVLYVLKSFANPTTFKDLGFAVLGGKGKDSRMVPKELGALERAGVAEAEALGRVSRLSAKVDGVALQDRYPLYIHGLVVAEGGLWTVIQQGMNVETKTARRYHIHGRGPLRIEGDPHSGIACNRVGVALNLLDAEAAGARRVVLDLALREGVNRVLRYVAEVNRVLKGDKALTQWTSKDSVGGPTMLQRTPPFFYRPVTDLERLRRVLARISEAAPQSLEDLLLLQGVGPETVRALALVADVIYWQRPSFKDPVTHALDPFIYSHAHGGKDGIPYPVKREVMLETIRFLEEALLEAKIEEGDRRRALKRLHIMVRRALALES